MEIILNKESFSNGIKIAEKITSQKALQPILSNVLIKTLSKTEICICATDLNLAIKYKMPATVVSEGCVTISARKISDIVSKISSSEITLKTQEESDNVKIKSGKTEFDLISMSANDFPNVLNKEEQTNTEIKTVVLNKNEFSKAIKQVIFAASIQETQAILTGVSFIIENNKIELAATDGNRLTRIQKDVNVSFNETVNFIVPSKTLQEVMRISSIIEDENITLKIQKNKILFEFKDLAFQSRLIEGIYPKYQQLIPQESEKKIIIDRIELINAIERVSIMVNDRTNVIKFNFGANQLEIMADTPEAGRSKDYIDIKYDSDDMLTAFNYKYILDGLKNMDSTNIEVQISDVLAASIFKPQDDNSNYICLIMPVKV